MSHTISFDTHALVKELKSAGFTEEQAEAQVMALSKTLGEFQEFHTLHLATKQDILAVKQDILVVKQDILVVKQELKQDIRELELRLKHDLTVRLGGMMVVGITLVATLVKLL